MRYNYGLPKIIKRELTMTDELVAVLDQEARPTDAEGKWPERCVKILAESGLMGLTMPADAGGGGAGMRKFAEVTEKIAEHCASTAMIYLMHVCGAQVIAVSSSPRRNYLVKQIASGKAVATLAFSEKGWFCHLPVAGKEVKASAATTGFP